jgi:hypothetical protein
MFCYTCEIKSFSSHVKCSSGRWIKWAISFLTQKGEKGPRVDVTGSISLFFFSFIYIEVIEISCPKHTKSKYVKTLSYVSRIYLSTKINDPKSITID